MPTAVPSDVTPIQLGKEDQFYIMLPLKYFTTQHAQNVERIFRSNTLRGSASLPTPCWIIHFVNLAFV